jgi:hypothetical protein
MSKKNILKFDADEVFDILVVGMNCGFKNYRICYELNEKFDFGLKRVTDITVQAGRPGSNTTHAKYSGENSNGSTCVLVANKDVNSTGYFISELKSIDYFLIFDDSLAIDEFNSIIKTIRDIKIVTGAFEVELKNMKYTDSFYILLDQ